MHWYLAFHWLDLDLGTDLDIDAVGAAVAACADSAGRLAAAVFVGARRASDRTVHVVRATRILTIFLFATL